MATATTTTEKKLEPNLNKQTNQKVLNVDLKGTLLTPSACANLVNEIVKTLLFQKTQIPYPYNWLKSVVDRKRKRNEQEESSRSKAIKGSQITVERHYSLVASTYDNLEELMCHIKMEMESSDVREVVLLFGATPLTPKQVYSIKLPGITRGHFDRNHSQANHKNQHNVLR